MLRILLLIAIACTGLVSAFMHAKSDCVFSYVPSGFTKNTVIIALEIAPTRDTFRRFLEHKCRGVSEDLTEMRKNFLISHTHTDFLFILFYTFTFTILLFIILPGWSVRKVLLAILVFGIAVLDVAENYRLLDILRHTGTSGVTDVNIGWLSKWGFSKWIGVFILIGSYGVMVSRNWRWLRLVVSTLSVLALLAFVLFPFRLLPVFGNVTHSVLIWYGLVLIFVLGCAVFKANDNRVPEME